MGTRVIKENEFKASLWSGGETKEIFIYPKDTSLNERNFDIRISSATCDIETTQFTPYFGFYRYISPVTGVLNLKSEVDFMKLKPYDIYRFDGDNKVSSKGKVRDYNLIARNGVSAKMICMTVEKHLELELDSNLIYVLQSFDGEPILKLKDEEIFLKGLQALVIEAEEGSLQIKANQKLNLFITTFENLR